MSQFQLLNRLFKGITVVLTVIGAVVIIWQEAHLIEGFVAFTQLNAKEFSAGKAFYGGLTYLVLIKETKLLLIASVVEIALVWLLVLLSVINRRRGLIATLVLSILVGITVFITYSFTPLPLGA
jgi:hypothetical protein